jgi:hypothetical protein
LVNNSAADAAPAPAIPKGIAIPSSQSIATTDRTFIRMFATPVCIFFTTPVCIFDQRIKSGATTP